MEFLFSYARHWARDFYIWLHWILIKSLRGMLLLSPFYWGENRGLEKKLIAECWIQSPSEAVLLPTMLHSFTWGQAALTKCVSTMRSIWLRIFSARSYVCGCVLNTIPCCCHHQDGSAYSHYILGGQKVHSYFGLIIPFLLHKQPNEGILLSPFYSCKKRL